MAVFTKAVTEGTYFSSEFRLLRADGELLVCEPASELPLAGADHWFGFQELARRHGDYAIVGMAATARRDGGVLRDVRVVLLGVDATPVRAAAAEAVLEGAAPDAARVAQAVQALRDSIDPLPDLTNTPETKRHLAGVLLQRLFTGAAA